MAESRSVVGRLGYRKYPVEVAARCKAGRTVVVTEGTTIVISLLEGRNNPFLLL